MALGRELTTTAYGAVDYNHGGSPGPADSQHSGGGPMSGAAKARSKTRPRRPSGRAGEERAGTRPAEPIVARPFDPRAAVPGPRTGPGVQGEAVPDPAGSAGSAGSGGGSGGSGGAAGSAPAAGEGTFARGYPAPADAVRCAMLGSPPTFWFDGDAGRLTVAVEAGRLVATAVAFVAEDLAHLVAAAVLNHEGESADAVEPVRAALARMAARAGHEAAEIVVDLSEANPRLGWLSRFDPAPWVTWHDWWAAYGASAAGRLAGALAGAGRSGAYDDCFEAQGLRVVRCADPACASPLTDRHPAWPGVWTTPGGALGPVCAAAADAAAWPAGLLAAAPHRITEG